LSSFIPLAYIQWGADFEAVRGEGAYLLNSEGDRFMAQYAPSRMELARDITSRAIARNSC